MAYLCELGSNQTVYLDNQGAQTIVTTFTGGAGQQQQSSSGFTTGHWTAPPDVFQTPQGVVIQLHTERGEQLIQVQGGSMSTMGSFPTSGQAQQMQVSSGVSMPQAPEMKPMQPMQPMQPMKMGNMEMNTNPMQMRMGNMEMSMGSSPPTSQRRFCSQCGSPIQPSDRFCANCGHSLQ
ncbi:zinc ribbon domain-containing protein [Spirulina subsalsa]|uniref:zinc ribbon domain-containing protein n=1 Tax=Spirulina subsalsa TaxID=54311 RepID=UPI000318BBB2|nr:zinc ribbon domain-containing protein [Spirulina subsalsa]